jgi:probable rRNA maturation factor
MLVAVGKPRASVTIAFVSDARIRSLNRRFRGIDKATDVLSFPNAELAETDDNLGDIAISLARAEVQARENELEFDQEIAQLILHGLLHLCGYDHETDNGEMNRLELRLRKKLGI